jgi:hypothetical protein
MKVTRHDENDHVILYVEHGATHECITLNSDKEVRLLGHCLIDLDRNDARQVTFGE